MLPLGPSDGFVSAKVTVFSGPGELGCGFSGSFCGVDRSDRAELLEALGPAPLDARRLVPGCGIFHTHNLLCQISAVKLWPEK